MATYSPVIYVTTLKMTQVSKITKFDSPCLILNKNTRQVIGYHVVPWKCKFPQIKVAYIGAFGCIIAAFVHKKSTPLLAVAVNHLLFPCSSVDWDVVQVVWNARYVWAWSYIWVWSFKLLLILSFTPELTLSFVIARVLEDVSFHPCVWFKRWEDMLTHTHKHRLTHTHKQTHTHTHTHTHTQHTPSICGQ